jgi:hypothetical protein
MFLPATHRYSIWPLPASKIELRPFRCSHIHLDISTLPVFRSAKAPLRNISTALHYLTATSPFQDFVDS